MRDGVKHCRCRHCSLTQCRLPRRVSRQALGSVRFHPGVSYSTGVLSVLVLARAPHPSLFQGGSAPFHIRDEQPAKPPKGRPSSFSSCHREPSDPKSDERDDRDAVHPSGERPGLSAPAQELELRSLPPIQTLIVG